MYMWNLSILVARACCLVLNFGDEIKKNELRYFLFFNPSDVICF